MDGTSAISAISSALGATVTIAGKAFEVAAVDQQAKDLLKTVDHLSSQLTDAMTLRRMKSSLFTKYEKTNFDENFSYAHQAVAQVAALAEPARADLEVSGGRLRLKTRLLFVLRDSPRIQVCLTQLGIASQGLNRDLVTLRSREGRSSSFSASDNFQSLKPPPPEYEDVMYMSQQRQRNVKKRSSAVSLNHNDAQPQDRPAPTVYDSPQDLYRVTRESVERPPKSPCNPASPPTQQQTPSFPTPSPDFNLPPYPDNEPQYIAYVPPGRTSQIPYPSNAPPYPQTLPLISPSPPQLLPFPTFSQLSSDVLAELEGSDYFRPRLNPPIIVIDQPPKSARDLPTHMRFDSQQTSPITPMDTPPQLPPKIAIGRHRSEQWLECRSACNDQPPVSFMSTAQRVSAGILFELAGNEGHLPTAGQGSPTVAFSRLTSFPSEEYAAAAAYLETTSPRTSISQISQLPSPRQSVSPSNTYSPRDTVSQINYNTPGNSPTRADMAYTHHYDHYAQPPSFPPQFTTPPPRPPRPRQNEGYRLPDHAPPPPPPPPPSQPPAPPPQQRQVSAGRLRSLRWLESRV